MPDQDGLEWTSTTFGLEPRWTREPDTNVITRIARKHLGHDDDVSIEVAFHAQGAFNKLYKINAAGSMCLLRTSLPVCPKFKTESEVATINFVRKHTNTLVPRIIASESSRDQNELGFEWILMEMMPGVTLRQKWRTMSWDAKETIVQDLVRLQSKLYMQRYPAIGNLYQGHRNTESFDLGPIVSLVFFWGDHINHKTSRGPFESDLEWLRTRLEFVLQDQEYTLKNTDDEDDIEDAEIAKDLAARLLQELPNVFPVSSSPALETILFHDDLSMENILVDDEGQLSAIIDWECVSTLPLWRACQMPQLLEGRSRVEKPEKDNYSKVEEAAETVSENEDMCELYWEHLMEYEQTRLREHFLTEMETSCSEWVAVMRSSTLQIDFEKAVHNCDNTWKFKIVKRWFDAYNAGDVQCLADQLIA